jgi:hypothetical protein
MADLMGRKAENGCFVDLVLSDGPRAYEYLVSKIKPDPNFKNSELCAKMAVKLLKRYPELSSQHAYDAVLLALTNASKPSSQSRDRSVMTDIQQLNLTLCDVFMSRKEWKADPRSLPAIRKVTHYRQLSIYLHRFCCFFFE